MRSLRRAEVICGIAAGSLGVLGSLVGWFAPSGGGGGQIEVSINHHLVENQTYSSTLAQWLGTPQAIALLGGLAALSLWVAFATLAHARSTRADWLKILWVSVGLLLVTSWATSLYVAFLFWPSALLGVVCGILASVQQARARRPGPQSV